MPRELFHVGDDDRAPFPPRRAADALAKAYARADAPETEGSYRGSVKSVRKVRSTDRLELPMAENGGAVAIFR